MNTFRQPPMPRWVVESVLRPIRFMVVRCAIEGHEPRGFDATHGAQFRRKKIVSSMTLSCRKVDMPRVSPM